MAGISGIGDIPGYNGINFSGPVSAATALAALRRHGVTSVEIVDTVQNIGKNLHALNSYASKITSLSSDDASKKLVMTGAQYQKDHDMVALWGAGSGQTVEIKGALASTAGNLASYVTGISVADSTANIQRYLDALQTATDGGVLTEITQVGNPGAITISATQLAADQGALDKIKNRAYALAITNANVSDVLGLGASPALASNSKIRSIAIVDTTDNIGDNLDALQRVGLRISSISQTDAATTHLAITGEQYAKDKLVLGKIVTSDLLDVMDVAATQLKALAGDQKVVTIDVKDKAANLSRNWALLSKLESSLTSIEVSDQANAINLTEDQFTSGSAILSKFTDEGGQTYKLAVNQVSAGAALSVAGAHNVNSVDVSDSAANLMENLADLKTVDGQGKLRSVNVGGSNLLSMDLANLQGDEQATTQALLDKIRGKNYTLSVSGMTAASIADLASNKRVVSMLVTDSSDHIESALATLGGLGSRLKTINQSDTGAALDLTQAQMTSYGSVLAKITGGYLANLTSVSAAKATSLSQNAHVGTVSVSDTGRNIVAHWAELVAMGTSLNAVSKSDVGSLSLKADDYLIGSNSNLVAKFAAGVSFTVTGANLAQAQTLNGESKVSRIEMSEESGVIEENLATLAGLEAAGKLASIINQTPSHIIGLDAGQLTSGQAVFDLIKGGSYQLSVSGVDVADAKALLDGNRKIANAAVTGTAADIVDNLSDLSGLGNRLARIIQTDAPTKTLDMAGTDFEANTATLAKIEGGYLAVLSDVSAANAATYAQNENISSLSVADTGANLASAWVSLRDAGSKLTEVAQSDSTTLHVDANDWLNAQALRDKFTSTPTVSLSGASVAQVSNLAAYDEVEALQVTDSANALAGAVDDLAAESKITQLTISDASQALNITAQSYSDDADVMSLISNSNYHIDLSEVAASDVAAILASDTHVSLMDVKDTAANVSASFDDLAAAGDALNSIELSALNETITLTANQILGQSPTLDKIIGSYDLAATNVAIIDLAGITDVPQTASIAIKDTSDNVGAYFGDILAVGNTLSEIQFSNASPALTLSEQDWKAGAAALGTITGSYDVDVEDVAAGDAQTVSQGANVRNLTVTDNASNVVGNWGTLVSLYDGGNGQLKGITLSDANPLALTTAQQTAGAAMITDLLAHETIVTAG